MAAGSHLNDRIDADTTGMPVRTVALDDLAEAGDFRPSFLEMDIEGAEFDALRGMPRLLADVRPVLVMEQSPDDMRCHALLTEAAYAAVDLSTYRRIGRAEDFRRDAGVANVLFVPDECLAGNPYFGEATPQPVAELLATQFRRAANGDIGLAEPLDLPAGRYLMSVDFTAHGTENSVFAGVESDGEVIFRYHTYTSFMAQSYADWVIQLDRPARVAPFLRFLEGADPTLRWNGVRVARLPAFDGWLRRSWSRPRNGASVALRAVGEPHRASTSPRIVTTVQIKRRLREPGIELRTAADPGGREHRPHPSRAPIR